MLNIRRRKPLIFLIGSGVMVTPARGALIHWLAMPPVGHKTQARQAR